MTEQPTWRRWLKPIGKSLLAVAILIGVGWQFYRDLSKPGLESLEFRWEWIALSGLLYLVALAGSGWYWIRLLQFFGQQPRVMTAFRAYFVGHLGKYVPGKAWSVLLRAGIVSSPVVRFGVAVITCFYEVFTTMAAGALVAAIVFFIQPPTPEGMHLPPLLAGCWLLAVCGVPLLPGVFNFLVGRMAKRFETIDAYQLPRLGIRPLLEGLAICGLGWLVMGLSVWALLRGVMAEPPELTVTTWCHYSASIGLSYVAGFLAFVLPSGLGVRELFLLKLLANGGPEAPLAAPVLIIRVVWTISEVIIAGVLWLLPSKSVQHNELATNN